MVVLMLGDHLVYFLPMHFPFELRYAGRLVLPTFAYLMTVSFCHTRDKLRFILRMGTVGLIMLAGNMILQWALPGPIPINNGIFLTLAVSAGLIFVIDRIINGEGNAILNALSAAAFIYAGTFVEGGLLTPVMVLVFYFLRRHRLAMSIVYIAVGWAYVSLVFTHIPPGQPVQFQNLLLFAVLPILLLIALAIYFLRECKTAMVIACAAVGLVYLFLVFPHITFRQAIHFQHFQFFAVIPILLYNGRKGGSGGAFDKWFFYIFYPLHVWWLYVIRHLLFFS